MQKIKLPIEDLTEEQSELREAFLEMMITDAWSRKDLRGRSLIITICGGAYENPCWAVISINGSPQRGTVFYELPYRSGVLFTPPLLQPLNLVQEPLVRRLLVAFGVLPDLTREKSNYGFPRQITVTEGAVYEKEYSEQG